MMMKAQPNERCGTCGVVAGWFYPAADGCEPTCANCGSLYPVRRRAPPATVWVEPAPKIHCAICNVAAPMVGRPSPHMQAMQLMPETAGWSRTVYPWPANHQAGVDLTQEMQSLCPSCAAEVAKFIAHRRTPMLSDEDLIG